MALTTITQPSIDTQIIQRYLSEKTEPGRVFTYEELSDLIGRNVRTIARGHLYTAIRRIRSEKQIVFETVRKIGIKHATDAEVVGGRNRELNHIRRTANSGAKKLGCVDFSKLSDAQKTTFNATASHLALFSALASSDSRKKLESRVQETQEKLSLAKTLEVFTASK